MKHFNFICVLILLSFAGIAQTNPCPTIVSNTLVTFPTAPNCTAQVLVNATGDVSSQKGLRIIVYLGANVSGTVLADTCHIVPRNSPSSPYNSPTFSYPCGATLTYEIIRYTASNGTCGGGECGIIVTETGTGQPLPIKLTSFNGNRKANNVLLNWNTAEEVNGSYFEIQRNSGAGFQTITKVNAKNAATGALYQFEDINVANTAVQYRLKLVDIDGSFKYSEVVSIKAISSVSDVSIYPNPAVQGSARIRINDISDITTVQVFDLRGTVLKNIPVTGNIINLSDLQAGSYLIKMMNSNTGGSATKRLIILK